MTEASLSSSEPSSMENKDHPIESKYRERLPYWLIVLVASILAIVVIWIMLIAIYPSIALS